MDLKYWDLPDNGTWFWPYTGFGENIDYLRTYVARAFSVNGTFQIMGPSKARSVTKKNCKEEVRF